MTSSPEGPDVWSDSTHPSCSSDSSVYLIKDDQMMFLAKLEVNSLTE